MCKCIETVEKKLAEFHAGLQVTHVMAKGRFLTFPVIGTEKTPTAPRGTRPKTMLPTYCPFCGKKYPDLKTA